LGSIFSRDLHQKKISKFNKLWAYFTQYESKLISKSQKTNDDENQELVAQVKKREEREQGIPEKSKKPCHRKDASNIICYN
jgi:hypothetical protein